MKCNQIVSRNSKGRKKKIMFSGCLRKNNSECIRPNHKSIINNILFQLDENLAVNINSFKRAW